MKRKVFISHKNTGLSNDVGAALGRKLIEIHGEENIFFDKFSLEGGDNWNQKIIDALLYADVVIVIVDRKTAESNWVQREIDMARARFISLLPVTLDEYEDVKASFKRFDMEKEQFIYCPPSMDPDVNKANIKKIADRVEPLALNTIANQEKAFDSWRERRKFKPNIQQKSRHTAYQLKNNPNICEFVIATGDATDIEGFDILVNTENDYFQMARFFETNTLSALVRWKGAEFGPANVLKRDTIQQQINEQLTNMGVTQLPVGDAFVLPTFAGHEIKNNKSKLRKAGFTYVFHAVAVKIHRTSREIRSLDPSANSQIVFNCMELASTLYDNNGAILYNQEGIIMQSASDKADADSILIPVFGAGQGGNTLEDGVKNIVKGFKEYFESKKDHPINKVGLCIYNFNDVELVESIFEDYGFELISEAD